VTRSLAVACATLCCALARPVSAQMFESIGVRAQGMAGAFVALADDASATWWNPAGLATGPMFSSIVERDTPNLPASSLTTGVSFTVPSLGLSYYRLRSGTPPSVSPGTASPSTASSTNQAPTIAFTLDQVGVTVGQSLGRHLVMSSTLKLVRADSTHGDIDLGAMLNFGSGRIGFVVKHLHEPDVTVDGMRLAAFDRQVRVGAAYAPRPAPLTVNIDVDADLTTTPTVFGNARHLAGGAELWMRRRFALRAGGSVNTIDERRPSFSAGTSLGVQRGLFIDGHVTRGKDDAVAGWGVGLRVTF
jgi:hypothetical protein